MNYVTNQYSYIILYSYFGNYNYKNSGINWSVSTSIDYPAAEKSEQKLYIKWKFEWDDTKGIDGFEGYFHFDIRRPGYYGMISRSKKVYVKVRKSRKEIEHTFDLIYGGQVWLLGFSLEPTRNTDETTDLDKNFESSEMTDVVLVVEGKKMHVNKGYLSMHSAYFHALFNSDFKEKSMEEIPIEDVEYSEFARLLSVVHPNPIFATQESCESLLELADRFLMPSVTRHVEQFLITNSDFRCSPIEIDPERILELADRFTLPNVARHVEKCLMKTTELRFCRVLELADKYKFEKLIKEIIGWICTKEHMQQIKASSEYAQIRDSTKARLSERILCL